VLGSSGWIPACGGNDGGGGGNDGELLGNDERRIRRLCEKNNEVCPEVC